MKSKNEEDAAKAEARNGEIAEAQDKAEQAEQQLKTKQDEVLGTPYLYHISVNSCW